MNRDTVLRVSVAALAALGVASMGGCLRHSNPQPAGPTGPTGPPVLDVVNWLRDAVDIHLIRNTTDQVVTHVAGGDSARVVLPVVSPDSVVKLRATTAGNVRVFERDSVVLRGVYHWEVP